MFQLKNIFSKNTKRSNKKSYGEVYNSFAENSFMGQMLVGGSVTDYKAMVYYRETAAISTAVDMVASAAEQIPLHIKDSNGAFSSSSPVLNLLANPNPAEDYRTFIGDSLRNYLLTGNCYFSYVGNANRPPLQIWSVNPQNISAVENGADSYPGNFIITHGGPYKGDYVRDSKNRDNWRFLTGNGLQELTQVRGYSSKSSKIKGDSPLESIMRDINQQIAGKIHNAAVLTNGGNISLVAVFKDRLKPEEMMERKLKIQSELGGPANSGKIAVIQSSDLELKDFGQSNVDMDFANLETISSNTIFKRYNVPLPLVTLDASTYSNYEQARIDLFDRAVIPLFDIVTQGLSKTLLPRMGMDPRKFSLTYNPETIPALRTRVLNELEKRRGIAIETVNELRSLLPSREAIGSEGDTVYQPSTMVPLNDQTGLVGDDGV
jgi:HK97 family phage portal protein